MIAIPVSRPHQRLLVAASVLSIAGCVLVAHPVGAAADEVSDSAVTIQVDIAPHTSPTDAGGLPSTGFSFLPPVAGAAAALLGGALLLGSRRRVRRG